MVASDCGTVTVMGSLPTGSITFRLLAQPDFRARDYESRGHWFDPSIAYTAPSSSGLGQLVFSQGTSVRIRQGLLNFMPG